MKILLPLTLILQALTSTTVMAGNTNARLISDIIVDTKFSAKRACIYRSKATNRTYIRIKSKT